MTQIRDVYRAGIGRVGGMLSAVIDPGCAGICAGQVRSQSRVAFDVAVVNQKENHVCLLMPRCNKT